MTVAELLEVLYTETPVEICLDFEPVFTGTANEAKNSRYFNRIIEEIYISIDGVSLVISIERARPLNKG